MINNIGLILLVVYLILQALVIFGLALPTIVLGVVALAAGILILIGR